ncbi:MAG: tRNA (guanosine(46)-N7)-methyltransferase TrmB [Cytophagales bacterium]|nr:tRNA (guanosine(46)-N7)-methyltransferase TrmB [Cytophagales bacterium]
MGKNKLFRFSENIKSNYIIEEGKSFYTTCKGAWNEHYFHNNNPIIIELGCGNGEYTCGLAGMFADANYVGVDIKGARLWRGSKSAEALRLLNVAFLRTRIDTIDQYFAPHEVSEAWITFPDPQPKDRNEKHRLTHPRFLKAYKNILKPHAHIHLKTDSEFLFQYTLQTIENEHIKPDICTHDLYTSEWQSLHHGIMTKYEKMFLAEGKKIHYLRFQLV